MKTFLLYYNQLTKIPSYTGKMLLFSVIMLIRHKTWWSMDDSMAFWSMFIEVHPRMVPSFSLWRAEYNAFCSLCFRYCTSKSNKFVEDSNYCRNIYDILCVFRMCRDQSWLLPSMSFDGFFIINISETSNPKEQPTNQLWKVSLT